VALIPNGIAFDFLRKISPIVRIHQGQLSNAVKISAVIAGLSGKL
jgi:hypothetical protein